MQEDGKKVQPRLTVNARDFGTAVSVLRKAKGGTPILDFIDGELVIHGTGISLSIPASGEWPGPARVPVKYLLRLRDSIESLPPEAAIVIVANKKELEILDSPIPCTWKRANMRDGSTEQVPVTPEHVRRIEELNRVLAQRHPKFTKK